MKENLKMKLFLSFTKNVFQNKIRYAVKNKK